MNTSDHHPLQHVLQLTQEMIVLTSKHVPWEQIEELEQQRNQVLKEYSASHPLAAGSPELLQLVHQIQRLNSTLMGQVVKSRGEVRDLINQFHYRDKAMKAYKNSG